MSGNEWCYSDRCIKGSNQRTSSKVTKEKKLAGRGRVRRKSKRYRAWHDFVGVPWQVESKSGGGQGRLMIREKRKKKKGMPRFFGFGKVPRSING